MTPRFITFEGGEGTGKSMQSLRLAARLPGAVLTREPGGDIRALLVSGDPGRWSPEAEALLNYAARDAHLTATIRPALARGQTVISDRFMDSTRAYQGHAGGCSFALIDLLEQTIVAATRPKLTLVFDLDPTLGLARAKARGAVEDRYERKGLAFHQQLREGFRAIAAADPHRCRIIDAAQSPEEVEDQVWRAVQALL